MLILLFQFAVLSGLLSDTDESHGVLMGHRSRSVMLFSKTEAGFVSCTLCLPALSHTERERERENMLLKTPVFGLTFLFALLGKEV
jgi:hypothetical protein